MGGDPGPPGVPCHRGTTNPSVHRPPRPHGHGAGAGWTPGGCTDPAPASHPDHPPAMTPSLGKPQPCGQLGTHSWRARGKRPCQPHGYSPSVPPNIHPPTMWPCPGPEAPQTPGAAPRAPNPWGCTAGGDSPSTPTSWGQPPPPLTALGTAGDPQHRRGTAAPRRAPTACPGPTCHPAASAWGHPPCCIWGGSTRHTPHYCTTAEDGPPAPCHPATGTAPRATQRLGVAWQGAGDSPHMCPAQATQLWQAQPHNPVPGTIADPHPSQEHPTPRLAQTLSPDLAPVPGLTCGDIPAPPATGSRAGPAGHDATPVMLAGSGTARGDTTPISHGDTDSGGADTW